MAKRTGKQWWLGIDVAKRTLAVALAPIQATQWRGLACAEFAHTPAGVAELIAWVKAKLGRGGQLAGIGAEATGKYSERLRQLWIQAQGPGQLRVLNPAQVAAFIKSQGVRDKRDRSDAALLALYCAQRQPPPQPEPDPTRAKLRELDRLRETLINDRTRWRNRLEDAFEPSARRHIERVIGELDKQIKELERELDGLIDTHETLAREGALLRTVPGIGPIGARTLLAELGDLGTSEREALVARAGLYPLAGESGSSLRRKPRLAKGGGSRVRRVLYMGATSLMRTQRGGAWDVGERLIEKGRPKRVAMGAMMRKLLLTARAVVRSATPYDPQLARRGEGLRRPPRIGRMVPIGEVLATLNYCP